MKINCFAILSFFSLLSGGFARPGNRFRAYGSFFRKRQSGSLSLADQYARIGTSSLTKARIDDNDPIDQKSRVTAFVNTDDGLKVECWEFGDFLPEDPVTPGNGLKGTVRRTHMAGNIAITLYSFSPSATIFSFGATGVHDNAIDFRARPNLFTVKDGLIFIEALAASDGDVSAREDELQQYVFADVNGDDWFYFEDSTSPSLQEQCAKPTAESRFNVRTISGSDTTLINFQYESTPSHRVLHEGRCNFAGLKPVSPSIKSKSDSRRFRFRSQQL